MLFLRHLVLSAVVLSLASFVAAEPSGTPPNFVVIMADDLGYGDYACYGGAIPSPNLSRMADEGMKFTDFHSSGTVCSPTRAGLVTGRYQQRSGLDSVVNADPKVPAHWNGLQDCEATFAELLKKKGYATAVFGKWHLGYTKNYNPVRHGFDRFRGFVSGNIDYHSHYDRMEVYDWWEGREQIQEEGYSTHLITKHSVEFIRQHRDRPFCLYVAHEAVHSPFQGPNDPPGRGPEATKLREERKKQPSRPKELNRVQRAYREMGVYVVVSRRLRNCHRL